MILTLELILILSTVPLFWHASRFYTVRGSVLFWIGGLFFALWRELAMLHIGAIYHYQGLHLMLGQLPILPLLLWPNLGYISWQWTNNLLGRDYLKAEPFDQHLPLIFSTGVFMAFVLETGFSQFGMIQWQVDSIRPLWGHTPLLAPFAYGYSLSLLLKGFRILEKQQKPIWHTLTHSMLLQPLLVLVLTGLLLLTNSLIILVFS